MEKLTDVDILARLIYRAYIAPDPHAPLEADALLPFQAALDLYARTRNGRAQAAPKALIIAGGNGPGELKGGAGGPTYPPPPPVSDPDTEPCCGDSCPVELT